jgi:thymidylate synthase
MNNLDKQYQDLLQSILDYGVEKQDRTGTGTKSIFGYTIRHNMKDGFPVLTTKKMAWKTMVTELLWFLRGDTNIKFLVDNGCHIWDGDVYKNYCYQQSRRFIQGCTYQEFIEKIKTDDEFAKKWGELGPVYGAQWRNWGKDFKQIPNETGDGVYNITTTGIDQIQNLINDLKTNPDSRRMMVNCWNVGELDQMVLPPCHYSWQVYTRELSLEERVRLTINTPEYRNYTEQQWKEYIETTSVPTRAISLMYNARSQDVPLGTPFNIASYALLLEIIAKMVNMVPDELITNMGDCHIYSNQIDGIKEQLTREPYRLPKLVHMKTDDFYKSLSNDLSLLTHLDNTDFVVENYQSHPSIKMPLSN